MILLVAGAFIRRGGSRSCWVASARFAMNAIEAVDRGPRRCSPSPPRQVGIDGLREASLEAVGRQPFSLLHLGAERYEILPLGTASSCGTSAWVTRTAMASPGTLVQKADHRTCAQNICCQPLHRAPFSRQLSKLSRGDCACFGARVRRTRSASPSGIRRIGAMAGQVCPAPTLLCRAAGARLRFEVPRKTGATSCGTTSRAAVQ